MRAATTQIEALEARVKELEAELSTARATLTVESSRMLATQSAGMPEIPLPSVGGLLKETVDAAKQGEHPAILIQPLHRHDELRRKWRLGAGLPRTKADAASHTIATRRNVGTDGQLSCIGILEDGCAVRLHIPFAELAREGGVTLGRDASACDYPLPDVSVSRVHARLELTSYGVVVTDLKSTNGVRLNDVAVGSYRGQISVEDGSILCLGDLPLRVEFLLTSSTKLI